MTHSSGAFNGDYRLQGNQRTQVRLAQGVDQLPNLGALDGGFRVFVPAFPQDEAGADEIEKANGGGDPARSGQSHVMRAQSPDNRAVQVAQSRHNQGSGKRQ